MPIIENQELYDSVKKEADRIYKKPSAYKSGFIVKKYKELGGQYIDDNKPKNLKRWYKESWESIANKDEYPVYRPTKRISTKTPLTASEIDPMQAIEQIALKQIIKGNANLPKFKKSKIEEIWDYSNPLKVRKNLDKYLGKEIELYLSNNPKKKYMIKNPHGKWVHFGAIGFSDYTKHQDINRKNKYLARATKIRGNWKDNPYSSNNLSLFLLWDY